ncbi:hypothetical protein AB433_09795 [Croceicoccus naphthovorans]|uniref:PilZ domain-containing protein n=2 Tax=Croceicoccus naphthovorans TaxID=1348774 RepID=A0A0G3XHV5_9SPHN|nr:hypothetical protein AB433_09795 [Croceicoccus naphthovorans]
MGGDVFVSVSDVSAWGCRLLNPSRNLFIGDEVTVFIDGLYPLAAVVRWHDRGVCAGFEFTSAVEADQLELLVRHCSGRVQLAPPQWRDGDRVNLHAD